MKKLTAILIFAFAFRVLFFYIWSGSHSPEFFVKANNFREFVTWFVYGAICHYLFQQCKEAYCGLSLHVFMIFSYSFSVICLRDFMPISINQFIEFLIPVYFKVWSIIAIVTTGYYLLTFRLKTA